MNDERHRTAHHDIHIWSGSAGTEWDVWLEPNDGDRDGLCLGGGKSRDEAVAVAVDALESALRTLQETPSPAAILRHLEAAERMAEELQEQAEAPLN